jgi:hypothetical protein
MTEAERITRALGGRWLGGRYGLAFCPAHENFRTPALVLGNGQGGQLLSDCKAGCTWREVFAALRGLGLLDGIGRDFVPDPIAVMKRAAAAKARRERSIRAAQNLWATGGPIGGTLAERYLLHRAIQEVASPALRIAPACWHDPSRTKLPAMLAAVHLGDELVAVHRTYLAVPGVKAPVDRQKAMLGPVRGGATRLIDGPGPLVVAEGIETTLSLGDSLRHLAPRLWAALSASGIAGLVLPPQPGELVIGPDSGRAGMGAAETLARRAHAAGWTVKILPPPGDGIDWNDKAREMTG